MLTISSALLTDGGNYDCVITNSCGSATSAAAAITVCVADFICDGFVTGSDFDAFISDFEFGLPAADVNGDAFITGDDLDFYVERFLAGC